MPQQHKTQLSHLMAAIILCASFLILPSCGQKQTISEEDLLGSWYTEESTHSISFHEDSTYKTSGVLCDGSYEITRDGAIILTDVYSGKTTIEPKILNDSEWALTLDDETPGVHVFIKGSGDSATSESGNHQISIPDFDAEADLLYAAAVKQVLESDGWITNTGDAFILSDDCFVLGDLVSAPVYITSAAASESAYRFSFGDESRNNYVGEIHFEVDQYYVPIKFSLTISCNGKPFCTAKRTGAVELTQHHFN